LDIDILSLFPTYFQGPFDVSIIKRAKESGILNIELTDIRDFATDKHRKVDDRPYGGGPGMVLKPQPVIDAIRSRRKSGSHVIHLSPQGKVLDAKMAERLAKHSHLILVCGHYEGLDERVIESSIDEEISIGDYVLTNGCLAAIVLVDAVVRFIPGVIGNEEAVHCDSFQNGLFDGPHYTRPVEFEGMKVPSVLQEGNHRQIQEWREKQAAAKTLKVRPDLYSKIGKELK
jgi:tRNA (guanine37-N1)-methyltransferase